MGMMRQRTQIGIEGFKGDERVFRVTPLDYAAEVKPEVAMFTAMGEQMLDMRDAQPGDGEIDIPLSIDQAKKMFPWATAQLSKADRANMFVNFK